ncbi:glycosyltransferase family 4 protein [uncultured Shimia sp.]|uniref:glycosyltransferase family 4 protein n=1 Tax=uncultured Shimia sp. TaxID=573152 RepID=UPI00262417CD|nr:glycosyltransferase family 4 protein [uncultured Shimia sp.]
MTMIKVVHLVDDTTAGGVMRTLDHLTGRPELTGCVEQSVHAINRGSLTIGRIDADVIVSHLTVSWRGLPGLVALRAMNASAGLVHVEHSYTRAFTALNVARKSRFFALLRVAYSLFDTVVSVSHAQADWLRARSLVLTDALRVIQPQVELGALTKIVRPTRKPRVIGAIGRLERQKGFDILIDAFRLCPSPDARLLIFGQGSEKARLEELSAGDPRIEFRGHAEDPAQAYREVDFVAVPSRWEAFGLVVREAKAAGVPVLLSPVDGLLDQVGDGAKPVAYCDTKRWANALEDVLRLDDLSTFATGCAATEEESDFAADWRAVFLGDDMAPSYQDAA